MFQDLNYTYDLLLTPQQVSPPYSPLLLIFLFFFSHFLKSHLNLFCLLPQSTPPSRSVSLRTSSQTSAVNSLFVLGTSSPTSSFLRQSLSNYHSCVLPSNFCVHAITDKYRTESDEDFVQNREEAGILKNFSVWKNMRRMLSEKIILTYTEWQPLPPWYSSFEVCLFRRKRIPPGDSDKQPEIAEPLGNWKQTTSCLL